MEKYQYAWFSWVRRNYKQFKFSPPLITGIQYRELEQLLQLSLADAQALYADAGFDSLEIVVHDKYVLLYELQDLRYKRTLRACLEAEGCTILPAWEDTPELRCTCKAWRPRPFKTISPPGRKDRIPTKSKYPKRKQRGSPTSWQAITGC